MKTEAQLQDNVTKIRKSKNTKKAILSNLSDKFNKFQNDVKARDDIIEEILTTSYNDQVKLRQQVKVLQENVFVLENIIENKNKRNMGNIKKCSNAPLF